MTGKRGGPGLVSGLLFVLSPLRSGRFLLLWAGLSVSLLGDGIYLVALVIGFAGLPSASIFISVAGAAFFLPQLVFTLIGGAVADRYPRRAIVLIAALVKAIAVGLLAWQVVSETPSLLLVGSLSACLGIAECFNAPALAALVPDLVAVNDVPSAISLRQMSDSAGTRLLGPLVGSVIAVTWSPAAALVVDAATFVLFAGTIAVIRIPRSRNPVEPSGAGLRAEAAAMLVDIRSGISFVRSNRWLLGLLLVSALGILATFGPTQALIPLLVRQLEGTSGLEVGWVMAAAGVGGLLGTVFGAKAGRSKQPVTVILGCWGAAGAAVALIGVSDDVRLVMAFMFAESFFAMIGFVTAVGLMSTRIPASMRGRVFSLDEFISNSLIPVSFFLAGVLSSLTSPGGVLVLGGVIEVVVVAIAFIPRSWQHLPDAVVEKELV